MQQDFCQIYKAQIDEIKELISSACHSLQLLWAGRFADRLHQILDKLVTFRKSDPMTAAVANARDGVIKTFCEETSKLRDSLNEKSDEDLADIKKLASHPQYAAFSGVLTSYRGYIDNLKLSTILLWQGAEDLPEAHVMTDFRQVMPLLAFMSKPVLESLKFVGALDVSVDYADKSVASDSVRTVLLAFATIFADTVAEIAKRSKDQIIKHPAAKVCVRLYICQKLVDPLDTWTATCFIETLFNGLDSDKKALKGTTASSLESLGTAISEWCSLSSVLQPGASVVASGIFWGTGANKAGPTFRVCTGTAHACTGRVHVCACACVCVVVCCVVVCCVFVLCCVCVCVVVCCVVLCVSVVLCLRVCCVVLCCVVL